MSSESVPFTLTRHAGRLELAGELDVDTAPLLLREVAGFRGSVLELDVGGLSFVDSSGVDALMMVREAHEHVRVVNATPQLQRLLEILGVRHAILDDCVCAERM